MRSWLTLTEQDCNRLRDVSESAWLYADAEQADLSAREIIIVGNGEEAKEQALALLSRGIDASKLSYVDLRAGEDFLAQIGRPKHLLWDDVVPVSMLDADEEFRTYPTGIGFLEKNLGWHWRLPELVILCGPYGCGKSTLGQ